MADKTGTDDTTAVEIGTDTAKVVRPSGDDTGSLPHHSFLSRLYTGTGAFEVIGRRRLWYGISGVIVGIAIARILSDAVDRDLADSPSLPAPTELLPPLG